MKDKLQQELLEKVKPGTKPSDIKKQRAKNSQKPSQTPLSPPPMEISKSDEGYKSDASNKSASVALPLPNQDLKNQIQALTKQLQLYKDFREGDLRIKEDLKKSFWALNKDQEGYKETITDLQLKNQDLNKTIEELKNQSKVTVKDPALNKTFTCSECNQAKSQEQLSRVFGNFSFCLECSKRARQEAVKEKSKPQPQLFICHLCEKPKTEIPNLMKLDSTLTEYLICQECKPHAKEFNEADLITDDLWEKYPYSSASEILELEFGIVKK